jgi:hypothetical protein
MTCARAGVVELQAAFSCRTAVTDRRTGVCREYRLVVLADGTVVTMRRAEYERKRSGGGGI